MALADFAFFIVSIFGVVGTINSGETLSGFTQLMIFAIVLGSAAFGVVLNINKPNEEHGTVSGEEYKSSSED
jgi:hypothetical protein